MNRSEGVYNGAGEPNVPFCGEEEQCNERAFAAGGSERYGTCFDENDTDVNNYATSTIHKHLNETYYNTLPQQDREKLGTKAVLEEFHGIWNGTATTDWKKTYGWNSLTATVWLPSTSELVGYTGTQNATTGCYYSAMQGLNASQRYWTDEKGGTQFAYFKQFNASGGGESLWKVCNQQKTWMRSPHCGGELSAWSIEQNGIFNTSGNNVVTTSRAVHPAVLYNPERPIKQTASLCFYRRIICLYLME